VFVLARTAPSLHHVLWSAEVGFLPLRDFTATTDVRAQATVRSNGYPSSVHYPFADQAWTWRIDPRGERPSLGDFPMIGPDGTCVRDGDDREVRHSMGDSDWWTDGRADRIVMRDS
jgi:hypothetical protein